MLAGKRWFSTLDLASGYCQVSLSPEARCKTAFATHSGLFQFRVMPFGLCNAPATFYILIVQPDILYVFYIIINGFWNRISLLCTFPVFPPQLVLSDQDFPLSTGGGRLEGKRKFFSFE